MPLSRNCWPSRSSNPWNSLTIGLRGRWLISKELAELKQLASLNLQLGPRSTDKGVRELKECTQITSLDLGWTKVTDDGLKDLAELRRLTWLDLGLTKVTDVGVAELRELKQLTYLNLVGTRVRDEGVQELKVLSELKELNLGHTRVSDVGVKELKGAQAASGLIPAQHEGDRRRCGGIAESQAAQIAQP